MKTAVRLRQVGFIIWSKGMNKTAWIAAAIAQGYKVRSNPRYATLWKA